MKIRSRETLLTKLAAGFFFLLISVGALSAQQHLPPLDAGEPWNLVFFDEFDRDTLDITKWRRMSEKRYRRRKDGSMKQVWWSPESVAVEDGKLVITTTHIGNEKGQPVYQSGGISTEDKFTKCGVNCYYEARVKMMEGAAGVNGAFWLFSPYVINESQGADNGAEIDILEQPWHTGKYHHAIHWDGYGASQQTAKQEFDNVLQPGEWYTFAVWWKEEEYIFYVDGEESWRMTGDISLVNNAHILFTSNMVAPWGTSNTNTPVSQLPVRFEVDYVRVYSPDESRGFRAAALQDGDFEWGSNPNDSNPENHRFYMNSSWEPVIRWPAKGSISYHTTNPYSGEQCLAIIVEKVANSNSEAWKFNIHQSLYLLNDTDYTLVFYAKSDQQNRRLKSIITRQGDMNNTTNFQRDTVRLFRAGNNRVTQHELDTLWTRYEVPFSTNELTGLQDFMRVQFQFEETGAFYLDSVALVGGDYSHLVAEEPPVTVEGPGTITSVDGPSQTQTFVIVYPNPVENKELVILGRGDFEDIFLLDGKGAILRPPGIYRKGDKIMIDVTHLDKGAYMLNIRNENEHINRRIIIK